jgi:hypothetical protein
MVKGFFGTLLVICVIYVGFLAGTTDYLVQTDPSVLPHGDGGLACIVIVFVVAAIACAIGWNNAVNKDIK